MSNSFDSTIQRINRQTEEQAAEALASQQGLNYEKLDDYPFSLDVLSLVDLAEATQKQYAPYLLTKDQVKIAIVHPENALVRDEIVLFGRKHNLAVEEAVVSGTSFKLLLASWARLIEEKKQGEISQVESEKQKAEHDYVAKIKTLEDLQKEVATVSTTELIDVIVAAAMNQGASDIHLEPEAETMTVRFRVDGVLQRVLQLPMTQHHHLISRIKILAHIKIDVHGLSQDGRFSMKDKGINVDVRVSIVPTGYGEGVVMRLLHQDVESATLEALGFSPYNLALIEKAIRRPYGLILVTGPTGSGKSTTLYAILQKLNTTEKKIITLEDPIEYRIPGVQQSQIDADHGFTFAEGLKGALRQDPDIVMVGEIRDPETATIALNASLTGHLVLSTLHTNDAITAHTRFLELGVEPFLLAGSINMIIAQRLVRTPVPGSDPANPTYKGRTVIAEVLCPTQEFERAVTNHADQSTLQELAIKGGMIPMLKDGMDKVKEGKTSESEIYRVTVV